LLCTPRSDSFLEFFLQNLSGLVVDRQTNVQMSGAEPTIASYNASVVDVYNTMSI
jgi:hypothetical protein